MSPGNHFPSIEGGAGWMAATANEAAPIGTVGEPGQRTAEAELKVDDKRGPAVDIYMRMERLGSL
jgi:hypothetical protein